MIKFLDLQKVNAQYAAELKQTAIEVIDKGWILLGERVKHLQLCRRNIIFVRHNNLHT
jgi:hypothetical protein